MRYIIKSIKYFIALNLAIIALYLLMYFVNSRGASSFVEYVTIALPQKRLYMMAGAFVVVSLLYPWFGFIKREKVADLVVDRDGVIRAFEMAGFEVAEKTTDVMIFRAKSIAKRARLLWEDKIEVKQSGDFITIEGIRPVVARVVYNMDTYLKNQDEE